ncbi:MAG: exo-alpha-sialidase [Chloroflexota bacterium]|nr:exo-alpha-sialidase [Chloroflexota bacterium]
MAKTSSRPTGRQRGRAVPQQRMNWLMPLIVGVVALLALGGWYFSRTTSETAVSPHDHPAGTGGHTHGPVDIPHIHGLGYSGDGTQLIVPAHTGLRIFDEGGWQTPDLPVNDYMGYAATDNGFYSSGHPGPNSNLPNPVGLVKSTDGGQTLTQLGFAGETDFHLMGVGYTNHAIYVLNPAPNSTLSAGLHYSVDDGKTWQQSAMQGIEAQPMQIAVHPTKANIVALATEAGLYLSADHGNAFERLGPATPVTAATFHPNGEQLLFGTTSLSTYDLDNQQGGSLSSPTLPQKDAISNIAVNPVDAGELTVATFGRNIYLTEDNGQSWQQIVQDGTGTTK